MQNVNTKFEVPFIPLSFISRFRCCNLWKVHNIFVQMFVQCLASVLFICGKKTVYTKSCLRCLFYCLFIHLIGFVAPMFSVILFTFFPLSFLSLVGFNKSVCFHKISMREARNKVARAQLK